MKRVRGVALFCLSVALSMLKCSCDHPTQLSTTGGSEVVGKLVTVSNAPVANARVFAYKIPADISGLGLDSLKKTVPVDTVFSNNRGVYKFTELDTGYYHLFASWTNANDTLFASHDMIHNDYKASKTEPTHIIDIGVDTMRAPGSISGKVIFQPGFSRPIHCYIPGSSFLGITDDTGAFRITNIPAGTYNLYYQDFTGLYAVVKDSNILVISNTETNLSPQILQLSIDGGPPAPSYVRAKYDTAGGSVILSWSKVAVSDLKEYLVYRKAASQDSFVSIGKVSQPETSFVDKVYSDSLDTAGHVYLYEIFSRDEGGEAGSHSDFCSVSVVSPASVRTLISLKAGGRSIDTVDTVAVFDKEVISCGYANGLVPVDSLIWSLEKPDSIVRRSWSGKKNGSDTLIISWGQAGTKKLYCTTVDNRGIRWMDSITVIVIKDTPTVTYLSPDTTIEFGGMVRCSVSISHKFGNCTLFIDLNRDGKFEITKVGLTYSTIFSTNTETTGGRINIRITDAQKNELDTFFTLTIKPAPFHNRWEEIDSMPTPRTYLSTWGIDKTIYAIGGCKRNFNGHYFMQTTNTVEAYDSVWSIKDTMDTARYSFISCVYDTSIYVMGGIGRKSYTKSIERYNIKTNTWSLNGAMPFIRAGAASCVYNKKLYVFGGRMPFEQDNDSISNSIYTFDFSNNQWSGVVGHMTMPRYDFQAVAIGNTIYLVGGYGGGSDWDKSKALADVETFDPSSNQCSRGVQMNSPRWCFAAASVNNSIYVIGGVDESNLNLINTISVFNPTNGVWRDSVFSAPHPEGRSGCSAGVIDGKIIMVGGGTNLSSDNAGVADGVVRKYYP